MTQTSIDPKQSTRQLVRQTIWIELRQVARPDSRFHWDFASFIPDFAGSEAATERALGLVDALALAPEQRRVFVTPDNSTEAVRHRLLLAGQPLVTTTYGIARGFLTLDPSDIPSGEARYAATLDGADRYGRPISMAALRDGPPFGVLMTGSAAVSVNGVRFGKGHGYFDLEWAILSELGLTDGATRIISVVHDCQVVDTPLPAQSHDVVVDTIVTPTRTVDVRHDYKLGERPLGKLSWPKLQTGELAELDTIAELKTLLNV